ncbi:putative MFS multidrug transporter [Phyllosticta citriasiana]|uniref:putative MFS multidrug transporter n=1 Tax=Phyllosticta citriasiana TaxID=595635 RepID=UPI0030FDD193
MSLTETIELARLPTTQPESSDVSCNRDSNLVDWDGPDDPGNPYNWSFKKKWTITAVSILATFTSMLNGTIITVAHEALDERFHINEANFPHSYWPVTTWAFGAAIFAFTILPLMEDFGFRRVFLGTYAAFLLFLIPQAVAQNFATLIVTRFFCGGCVSIIANSASSLIGNIWADEHSRTVPMSLWIAVYLAGSSMGPVIGATVFKFLSWRWISYCQLIWCGALYPVYWMLMPETRNSVILLARAKKLRKEGKEAYTKEELDNTPLLKVVLKSFNRPLYMLVTEPVAFVCTLIDGLVVGTIYLFTQSTEQIFASLYGWTPVQAGFLQSAVVVGEIFGLVGALGNAKLYFASAKRNTEIPGTPIPEARLYMSIIAGFLGMTGGMFVYAWTAYPSLPWIAPAVGLAMVGAGNTVVIIGACDYIVDAYAKYAASAIAACALGENVLAAFIPLAAQSMYNNLGYQWASSLLGFVALALTCGPVVLVLYGRQIRDRSPFMKEAALDKKKEAGLVK